MIGRPPHTGKDPAQTLEAIHRDILAYSTQTGRIEEPKTAPVRPKGDGIVRIQRQTSGRKGKGVCLITGIEMNDAELNQTGG